MCVCVPLPPCLVSLFPSLYCRACQTAELSQQGVRPWKGRECDRGGEIRWLKATFQHLFWGTYELMMAGAADQNLANGGGGVPLGPGLPPIWAEKRPWKWCCVQAIYFLTMIRPWHVQSVLLKHIMWMRSECWSQEQLKQPAGWSYDAADKSSDTFHGGESHNINDISADFYGCACSCICIRLLEPAFVCQGYLPRLM